MTQRTAQAVARDRGAAAVEFALLLPVLLVLLFGIVDFGRALHTQVTLTQAAREGARLAALGKTVATVQTRTGDAAGELAVAVTVTPCPSGAGSTSDAEVVASHTFTFLTPIGPLATILGGQTLGAPIALQATGVMPCET